MSGFTCTNNQISYIAQIEQTVVTNGDCLQLNSIDISKDATGRVYTTFFDKSKNLMLKISSAKKRLKILPITESTNLNASLFCGFGPDLYFETCT